MDTASDTSRHGPRPVRGRRDGVVAGWLRTAWLDLLLAAAVTVTVTVMISADLAGERAPDAPAYLWAVGLGALMLVRRSHPLLVLWLTVLGLFAYYAVGYPAVGLSVPTAAALFSAAEQRGPRAPVAAAAVLLVVSHTVRLLQGQDPVRILGYEAAGHVALMAAAIALGDALRTRRRLQRQSAELLEATVRLERARGVQRRAQDRAAIARELHDSLGHQASVITLHSDLARETVQEDPGAAAEAMDVVADTARSMTRELRETVRQLRAVGDGSQTPRTPPTVEGLRGTVIPALPLTIRTEIDPPPGLPPSWEAAAHRIVQEALTNVLHHSAAEEAEVRIVQEGRHLLIEVSDPGPARTAQAYARAGEQARDGDDDAGERGGAGLPGIRERAAIWGGTVEAGPAGQGFRVRALLPLPESEGSPS